MRQPTVLLVSPQACRMGHGALHGQRTLQAFSRLGCWRPILLTGRGFKLRSAGLPLEGIVREIDVGLSTLGGHRGPMGAIVWGVRYLYMQQKLFADIPVALQEEDISAVLFLDGNPKAIFECWQRCRTRFPDVGWVVAHNMVDFWLKEFSVRSLYKAYVASRVRQMAMGMGATILYGEAALRDEFCHRLRVTPDASTRIFTSGFGSDPEDLRMSRDLARRKLGIPLDAHVALFFGMIRSDKRPKVAVDAVGRIGSPWWLVMAGKPQSFGEAEIQGWVAGANLRERSVLMLRYLAEEEVKDVFSAANVLISPHNSETLANSGPLCLCRSYRLPAIVAPSRFLGGSISRDGVGLVAEGAEAEDFCIQLGRFAAMRRDELESLETNLVAAAGKYSFEATVRNYQEALGCSVQYAQRK